MAYQEVMFYAVVCDYPGCGAQCDGDEYTYWEDKQHAIDVALGADWLQEEDGGKQRLFCDRHYEHVAWLADESEDNDDVRALTLPDGERVVLA